MTGNKNTLGKKLSDEHKLKLSIALKGRKYSEQEKINHLKSVRRGDKCNLWKGGITPINKLIRTSYQYKEWRRKVFERDNYTCVLCGIHTGNGKRVELNADHIKPFSQYHELRFDINNGRTLCNPCHKKTDTYGVNLNKKIINHE